MGRAWKYYSNWQHEIFACAVCGWTGTVSHQDLDVGDAAAIIECPKCQKSLGVVLYPSLRDTREAAVQGDQGAIAALPGFAARVKKNWDLLKKFAQEKIDSADQLPELEGESLEFVWDFVNGSDGEYYQVIRAGEKELWWEFAFFNNLRRFEEVKHLLRKKYGARFKSLTPTAEAVEWLVGDNVGKAAALSYR